METIAVVPGIKSSSPKLIAPRWHTVLFVALFLTLALSGALFQREARSQPGGLLGFALFAPRWHTVLFVALFLTLALSGALFQREARSQPGGLQQHPHVVPLYLSLIAMEWGLFLYVWKGGLRRSGTTLRELIGGRWGSVKDVAVDAGLALGLWTVWTIVEKGWDRWVGLGHAASIQTFLPRRASEILLWVGVSVSAGVCEELVFRGYFQKQFEVFTRSKWIALFLQAA